MSYLGITEAVPVAKPKSLLEWLKVPRIKIEWTTKRAPTWLEAQLADIENMRGRLATALETAKVRYKAGKITEKKAREIIAALLVRQDALNRIEKIAREKAAELQVQQETAVQRSPVRAVLIGGKRFQL